MNTYFHRLIACAVFLFPTVTQVYAQGAPPPVEQIEQKQQERIQANRAKNMEERIAAPQTTAPVSQQEDNYTFMLKMRKMMMKKMRRSGGSIWGWEPTEWQKTLPPIVVQEGGATKSYSFTDLINADGYLCPGSARAYKALHLVLPLLYKETTPVKGDFKITHGPSLCTSLVYDFFMEGYTDNAFLELDRTIKKKLISIERLSTGEKITVIFSLSKVQGHDPAAAAAGDLILRAQEGEGITLIHEDGQQS